MSAPYPRLTNGTATSQGIWDVVTSPVTRVGTRGVLDDGRVFYYARNSGAAALVAGNMLQMELVSVDWDDLATDTHTAGQTAINATPVGTKTYTENELSEGYAIINSGTAIGYCYKIKSHPATTAATAVDLELYDPIALTFGASDTVTVMKNPWMDVVISANTAPEYLAAGCAPRGVPAGDTDAQYFWCQTWGIAATTAGDTTTAGEAVMCDTTTAGETLVATAGLQVVGINIFAGVNADSCPTFLMIAP